MRFNCQVVPPADYLTTGVLPSYDETNPLYRSPLFSPKSEGKERSPLRERFPCMWEDSECGTLTLAGIRKDFRKHRSQVRPLLIIDNGQARVGCTRSKFSKKYLSKSEMILKNSADLLSKLYAHQYMITFTIAPIYRDYSPLRNWKKYSPEISRALERIARRMDGAFVHVVESHKDGNPHWHAILFTDKAPNEVGTRFGRRGKTQQIYAGKLYNAVVENWEYGRTDITVVKDKQAVGYCAKYIAKGAKACFEHLCEDKELTAEQYKWALTFMGSTASGCRQFAVPLKKKVSKTIALKWGFDYLLSDNAVNSDNSILKDIANEMREEYAALDPVFSASPRTREARARSCAPQVRFLDGLCTNSHDISKRRSCAVPGRTETPAPLDDFFPEDDDAPFIRPDVKIVRMYSPRTAWGRKNLNEFEKGQLTVSAFKAFFQMGARVGKGETVYQHIENQRLTECDPWFNFYVFDKSKALLHAYARTVFLYKGFINGHEIYKMHPALIAYYLPDSPVAQYRAKMVKHYAKKFQLYYYLKACQKSDEIQKNFVQRQKEKFREREDKIRALRKQFISNGLM